MKKLTAIFSLLFSGAVAAFAQSSVQQFQIDEKNIDAGYVTQKVWLEHFAVPKVTVEDAGYREIGALPKDAAANDVRELRVLIGMERKRPFAFIQMPVYKLDEQTKQYRQLTTVDLRIEEGAAAAEASVKAKTTASGSVLANGNWYKISVAERGIFKIDYNFIKDKLGVDPASIDTRNIRVYGNGGVMMSENNAIPVPDDLVENPIEVHDGGDNSFGQGDYILFYANGPMGWVADANARTFNHVKNLYEDKSYYFINFDKGEGQRIATVPGASAPNVTVSSYDRYQVHEQDLVNIGKFGKKWWGEDFGIDPGRLQSRTFSFNTGSPDTAIFRISLGSRSASLFNSFKVNLNGSPAATYTVGSVGSGEEIAVRSVYGEFRAPAAGGSASLELIYNPGDANARGYLDYIEILSRQPLILNNGLLDFRDWKSVGTGKVAAYVIQTSSANTAVWDVTNPLAPGRVAGVFGSNAYSFVQDAADLREYIAFDGSRFLAPEFVEKTDNQNLHATGHTDFVIVSHQDLLPAAERLADFHRQNDGMTVLVTTPQKIYNEFSSGSQDIGAIRDLMRMLYKNAGADTTKMPRYLLLFGDASYDYKDRVSNNSNMVPTYETAESEDAIYGYCSDDFFSFLDDHEHIEGVLSNGYAVVNTMDLGVGRIPVTSLEAANRVVDKILGYASPASLGPWRLSTTIMADDGDSNIHFEDGEDMASTINAHTNLYNENKVYISALPTVSTPGGLRCPDANKSINDNVYKGTFLMNYNGHGSITTMAHERILTQDDFNNWRNANKLPIVITATCTYAKYDDPAYVSSGEQLMIKPDGGAIALFTTTQLVFQYLNHTLNVNALNAFFRKYNGKWPTFGDAYRIGKNATYSVPGKNLGELGNFRKFALLGDPALTPAFPRHNIHTEAILDGYTMQPVDTMKALGKYQISGSIKDASGQLLNDFNGRVYVTIYDKARVYNTVTGPSKSFKMQNSIIYRGKATVANGLFSFMFIAPKDINYDMGKGKISYYAENGSTDAAGSDTTLSIGGFSDVVINDTQSPVVKPFMNDSLFKDGGITGSNSVLYVQLSDESGINVSGNSVGHDLTGVLDGDVSNPYILNDYYETAANDYTRGYVNFPVTDLPEGRHSLRVKAWDMFNNSGEGTVNFEVINGQVVKVLNLMNYPNPFTDKTHFVFEHNHPGENLKVRLNIYSTSGYLVRTLGQDFTPNGSRSTEITWDGTDNNGAKLPGGVYVYKLNLSTEKGIQETAYQKLVLIR